MEQQLGFFTYTVRKEAAMVSVEQAERAVMDDYSGPPPKVCYRKPSSTNSSARLS